MLNALNLFVRAIREKKPLSFRYDGFYREMCVHVVGYKNGRLQALAFQFSGQSKTMLPFDGEWRCVQLDLVSDIRFLDGPWRTKDNHSRQQSCVDEIIAEVDF